MLLRALILANLAIIALAFTSSEELVPLNPTTTTPAPQNVRQTTTEAPYDEMQDIKCDDEYTFAVFGCNQTYYQCNHGAPISRKCPGALFFDIVHFECKQQFLIHACTHPNTGASDLEINKNNLPQCKRGDDYVANENLCSRFYGQCSNGQVIRKYCPYGQVWVNAEKYCNFEARVPDCLRQKSSKARKNKSKHGTNGSLQSPQKIKGETEFSSSEDAIPVGAPAFAPPEGSEELLGDDMPEAKLTPPPSTTMQTTVPPVRATTTIRTTVVNATTLDCAERADGRYVIDLNACTSSFFRCKNGKSFKFHCPPKLFYDFELDKCTQDKFVPACGGVRPVTKSNPPTTSKSQIDCTNQNGQVFVENDCNKVFIACQNGAPKTLLCPDGSVFSSRHGGCTQEALCRQPIMQDLQMTKTSEQTTPTTVAPTTTPSPPSSTTLPPPQRSPELPDHRAIKEIQTTVPQKIETTTAEHLNPALQSRPPAPPEVQPRPPAHQPIDEADEHLVAQHPIAKAVTEMPMPPPTTLMPSRPIMHSNLQSANSSFIQQDTSFVTSPRPYPPNQFVDKVPLGANQNTIQKPTYRVHPLGEFDINKLQKAPIKTSETRPLTYQPTELPLMNEKTQQPKHDVASQTKTTQRGQISKTTFERTTPAHIYEQAKTAKEPASCGTLKDGNYAVSQCGGVFIKCYNKHASPERCPSDQKFNTLSGKCENPQNIPECPNFLKPVNQDATSNGIHALPIDPFCERLADGTYSNGCSHDYYVCLQFNTLKMSCPADLYFDLSANQCRYKFEVPECNGHDDNSIAIPPPADEFGPPIPQIQPIETEPYNKPLPQHEDIVVSQILQPTRPVEEKNNCLGKKSGIYGVGGCTRWFLQCLSEAPTLRKCQGDLYYNELNGMCDHKENVFSCQSEAVLSAQDMPQKNSRYPLNAHDPPAYSCAGKPDGHYSVGCSNTFWACANQQAVMKTCGVGLRFSVETQRCDFKEWTPECGGVIPNIIQNQRGHAMVTYPQTCVNRHDGVYAIAQCSSDYFTCYRGGFMRGKCEFNLIFDQATSSCRYRGHVEECPSEPIPPSIKMMYLNPDDEDVCVDRPDGIAPFACSNKFTMCTKGKATNFFCPGTLVYDFITRRCNFPNLVGSCTGPTVRMRNPRKRHSKASN